MLIRFFRSSFIIQYLALVLITVAIWVPGFLEGGHGLPVGPGNHSPLYNLVYYLLTAGRIISPAIAIFIIFISALTLNNILIYHDLAPKNNLLPALLFILLMSSNPRILCTYPIIIALPLLTWFLHTLYKINDEPENFMEVFNASIIISVISMIYPVAIFLYFFIWLVLLIYGSLNGRNLVISFIALLIPYIYFGFYLFWTDKLDESLKTYLQYFGNVFTYQMNMHFLQLMVWGVFVLLMLVPSFTRITSTLGSFNINFRKKMAVTAWLLAFTMPMTISQGNVDYNTLIFLPSGIMIAHYFNLFKKSVANEIILMAFLILILLNNYLYLLYA